MQKGNTNVDKIHVRVDLIRELGLGEALILSYAYHQLMLGSFLITSARGLAYDLPMSKSAIHTAIQSLITKGYLYRFKDVDPKIKDKCILTEKLSKTFHNYESIYNLETRKQIIFEQYRLDRHTDRDDI